MNRRLAQSALARRRGTILPMLVFAILAICAAGALVLDRLWIDAAQVQLNAAAEAAALAAASRLADDDRLREPYDAAASVDNARAAADFIARGNFVAGHPVELDLSHEGDVRFGKIIDDPTTGNPLFLETDIDPTSVFVVAQVLKERGNPLIMFFRGVTGEWTGDAQGHAEATIDPRVIGFRPVSGSTVPCFPLALLEVDPTGSREQTWQRTIDRREGDDLFGYDDISDALVSAPDGIPEITLTVDVSNPANTNVHLIDLGTGLNTDSVRGQIAEGISKDDLADFSGALLIEETPLPVDGSATKVVECADDLRLQIGQRRIALLYQQDPAADTTDSGTVFLTRLVAMRILAIEQAADGPLQIIVQPAVLATRTAVLSEAANAYQNPYVYKLSVTH